MKRTVHVALLLMITLTSLAQEDLNADDRKALRERKEAEADSGKVWTRGGVFQLNFSQVQLINWAAGGNSSISGLAQLNAFANKRKDRWAWDNSVALAYGLIAEEGRRTRKSDDRLELNSRLGYQLSGPWFFSGLFQFRTQFTEGFDATNDTVRISNFLAPGYLLLGLGIDYKPSDKFSFYLSPVTAKITFVQDQVLADRGAFGVEPAVYEVDTLGGQGARVTPGENVLFQLGAYANLFYTTELAKNITFLTRLDLFSNYLKDPQNIDVNWETVWTFKVNEWFAASVNTLLVYDHDIDINQRLDDGTTKIGPATQFKQTLSLGLTAKF